MLLSWCKRPETEEESEEIQMQRRRDAANMGEQEMVARMNMSGKKGRFSLQKQ